MARLVIDLHTEQPVLVSSLQGDPNSTVTLPYLTGSMIRGACIGVWRKQNGEIDSADKDCQRLFFNGATRFLNAYPVIDGQRSYPTPLAWKTPKDNPNCLFEDTLYQNQSTNKEDGKQPNVRELAKKSPFMFPQTGPTVDLTTVETQLAVHSTRSRKYGRAIKPGENESTDVLEHGAVFQYEALAEGQTFRTYILGEKEDLEDIQYVLQQNDILWLGRSRSAGYGRVRITKLELDPNNHEITQPAQPTGTQIYILALSDLILRTKNGDLTINLAEYLGEQLGINELKPSRSLIRSTIIGGFNRTWGLPLPQTQAVQAGSACLLEFKENISPKTQATLLQLQTSGLGERRAEGFGRILVGLEEYTSYAKAKAKESQNNKHPFIPDLSNKQAETVWERILRQRFEQRLLELAGSIELDKKISNSQLSQLEVATRQELTNTEATYPHLSKFTKLDITTETSSDKELAATAASQFRQTTVSINGKPEYKLPQWIKSLSIDKTQTDLWKIELQGKQQTLSQDAQKQQLNQTKFEQLMSKLKREYTLRLLLAVIKRTRRLRMQEEVQHV